jgi:hypothetical protein
VIHTEGMWSVKEDQYAHSRGESMSSNGRRTVDANLTRSRGQLFNHNDKTRIVVHV